MTDWQMSIDSSAPVSRESSSLMRTARRIADSYRRTRLYGRVLVARADATQQVRERGFFTHLATSPCGETVSQ